MKKSVRPTIALDFGTANCLIIKNSEGIVLAEPTVVAISLKDKKVHSVGQDAKDLLGKEPQNIVARRPLQNGGISNYSLAYKLMEEFLDKALGKMRLIKPNVIVSVPSKINSIEERALVKALESYGVNEITLYPEPMAAAIGASLPVSKPAANMIINLGGGTAEIALISLNGIVHSASHIGSGDAINNEIQKLVKEKYKINIGEHYSEKIKMEIANALIEDYPKELLVSGKDINSFAPRSINITSNGIQPAIRFVLDQISGTVKSVLNDIPSELHIDLTDRGIALSGGTSQIHNIDTYFTKTLNIPCYVVEDPMSCVVRGLRSRIG